MKCDKRCRPGAIVLDSAGESRRLQEYRSREMREPDGDRDRPPSGSCFILKKTVVHAKSRSSRRKTDGYAKHLNHLVGEAPLFNNCLISLRLRVFV
jgi:hypothetical protein